MWQILRQLLGNPTPRSAKRSNRKARLHLEELSQRVLPSASSLSEMHDHEQSESAEMGSEHSGSGERHHEHSHISGATFVATLSDASGATGKASFNATTGALNIRVKHAAADTSLNVAVNGTNVGTLSTNDDGRGHTTLTNVPVAAGSTITVGTLTGSFMQVQFSATLTGTTGASGSANYRSTKDRLDVSISGAAAETSYSVKLNSTVVGRLKTHDSGSGHFELEHPSVTIQSGTTISISDQASNPAILTGTFA